MKRKAFLTALFLILCSQVLRAQEPQFTQAESFKDLFLKGDFNGKLRSFYMNRHFDISARTQESSALGAWLDYESAYWHHFGFGIAAYTSLPFILHDVNKDGAQVLKPGQTGYVALGKIYFQAEAFKSRVRLFRQELNTPFLNPHDIRMTPVTYEAYTLQNWSIDNLELMFSHVTKIKKMTETQFKSLSSEAGFPGTKYGITMFGLTYLLKDSLKAQAWDYYAHNFMNMFFMQVDKTWKIQDEISIVGSIQGLYQHNIGRSLNGKFNASMLGAQFVFSWFDTELVLAYTIADNSSDIQNPWASYPGFTSIMEEDNDLSGEKAWLVGLTYDFSRFLVNGLSLSICHAESYQPDSGSFFNVDQYETDMNLSYRFKGKYEGLLLSLRAALVDHSFSVAGERYSDFRIIINYDF
jgi:hypothetical protein